MLTSEKPLCSFVQLGGYQTQKVTAGRLPLSTTPRTPRSAFSKFTWASPGSQPGVR